MRDELVHFTFNQGNILIRLLFSHLLADFVFQTNSMVLNKKWLSKQMFLHLGIVLLITLLLSLSWKIALILTLLHWLIDGVKCNIKNKFPNKDSTLFWADQFAHLLSILIVWVLFEGIWKQMLDVLNLLFIDFRINLLLLGYILVLWPVGHAMKFVLKGIEKTNTKGNDKKLEHGGKLIGMFERLIILTFVYLNQFEAIGFLITGKSIIRFTQKEEGLRSEYVLVGTMMSYAFSILVGVIINWLLG